MLMDGSPREGNTIRGAQGALADFERVILEVRARFEQFLSNDERRILDDFSRLPDDARQMYASLFRRKFPQWVDDLDTLEPPWVRRPCEELMGTVPGNSSCVSRVPPLTYGEYLLKSLTAKQRKELPFGGVLRVAAMQKTLDKKCGTGRLFSVLCTRWKKVILDPDIRAVFVLVHRLLFPFSEEPTQATWMMFHRQDFTVALRCSALGKLVQPFQNREQIDGFFAARELQCEYDLSRESGDAVTEHYSEAAECGFYLAPVRNDCYSAHFVFGHLLWRTVNQTNDVDPPRKIRRLALLLDKACPLLRVISMRHLRWFNALSVLLKDNPIQAHICARALRQPQWTCIWGDPAVWNAEVEELSKRAARLGVDVDIPEETPIEVKEISRMRKGKRGRGGQRVEYVGYKMQSVENVVLQRYVPQDFDYGVHCEGSVLTRLFYILFEDILVECGEYTSAYESRPLALLDGRFGQLPRVRDFVATLATWSFEDLTRAVQRAAVVIPSGEPIPPACAAELAALDLSSLDDTSLAQHNVEKTEDGWIYKPLVMQCGPCIGGVLLSKIYDRMMTNWRYMTGGLPDLLLWNTEKRVAAFVEVKSEHDRLSTKQAHWMRFLHDIGAQAWVCHVRDTKVIEL